MGRYAFAAVLVGISALAAGGCARPGENAQSASNGHPAGHAGLAAAGAVPGTPADGQLASAVAPLARSDGGNVSVSVDDLTTGVQASYNGTREQHTASIAKVDILATILYQDQRKGTTLSPHNQQLATTMIENSSDTAASSLWDDVGGSSGVAAANRAFGLTETTPGSGPYWGLTNTTSDDQVQLLRQVLTGESALSGAARDYEDGLMSETELDQRWGVPAAADPGTSFEVKNGWLPDPDQWVINSDGEITSHGQRMLVSVLSDDNASEASGIGVVQQMAKEATAAVAAQR